MGMSTRTALLWQTAAAMAGVISPSSESAMTMPMGPTMMSARRQLTTTAFSPVAAVEELSEDLFRGRCRLLPYQAVGVECGMLLALRLDDVRVGTEDYGGILVALSPTRLSDGGGYSALIGA